MTIDDKIELLVNHNVDSMSLDELVSYAKTMMTDYYNGLCKDDIDDDILDNELLEEDEL